MPGAHPSLKVLAPSRDPEQIEERYGKEAAAVWAIIRDAQRVEEAGEPPGVAEVWELEATTPAGVLRTCSIRVLEPGWLALAPEARERLCRMFPADPGAVAAVAASEEAEVAEVWIEAAPPGLSPRELLRRMARKGYGRPSTYADHVASMRDWFGCGDGRMVLDDWGRARHEELRALPVVIDAAFTADLEAVLDRVERGEVPAEDVLAHYVRTLVGGADVSPEPLVDPVTVCSRTGPEGACEGLGTWDKKPASERVQELSKGVKRGPESR